MNQTLRLNLAASEGVAELGRAMDKLPMRGGAVAVQLSGGARPVEDDEILVVVLSARGLVASRSTVHGREVDLRDMRLRLAGAQLAVDALGPASRATPQLTAGDAAQLDQAGLVEEDETAASALERSTIEYELMLRDSLSLEQAARVLRVKTTSRLRQRLAARTLYGLKDRRSWRIPRFQFGDGGKLVRGIDRVLPHVRADAHPLAVKSWFSTPHQDLVLGRSERRVTPLAWLAAGHSPEDVARLAEEI